MSAREAYAHGKGTVEGTGDMVFVDMRNTLETNCTTQVRFHQRQLAHAISKGVVPNTFKIDLTAHIIASFHNVLHVTFHFPLLRTQHLTFQTITSDQSLTTTMATTTKTMTYF